MAYVSTTVNWDTIRSITNPKVAQKISDNITGKIPVIYFLNRMGHKEYEDGGYQYQLPVFKELQSAEAYSGDTVLSTVQPDPSTVAIYNRKQLSIPIVATGTQLLQNGGNNPESVVNFIAFMIDVAEESMKNSLGGSTVGIFSSLGESDLGVTGLQNILTTTNTTGTVGGLSRATFSFWRHIYVNCATGFNTSGQISLRSAFYQAVRGDEAPTIGIMNQSSFINFERSLVGTLNYYLPTTADKMAYGDLGYQTLNWHGTPFLLDSNCPANSIYLLNLKYLKLLVHRERDMSIRDFIAPSDQDAIVARMYWAGNLVCTNLARQALIGGLPDTWA